MTFYEGLRVRLAGAVCAAAVIAGAGFATVHARGEKTASAVAAPAHTSATSPAPTHWGASSLGTIDPQVFDVALRAASCAISSGDVAQASTLTVIDYSKPSTTKRLWVFDLVTESLLYNDLVAHGQGSGDNYATRFSNEPETHRSSLGLFVAQDTYEGKNGYSLRLNGLDRGFNDRALERAIVMHGAPYVSDDIARVQGRIGRSWGCPALREGIVREVIDRIKRGGLVFAYYPDEQWLKTSKYLTGQCAGPKS